jgi:hypothetical protein
MPILHWTKWSKEQFELNKEYYVGSRPSDYWRSKIHPPIKNVDLNDHAVLKIINMFDRSGKVAEDLLKTLTHLKYSSESLKEYVFEDVRSREFPEVPSRKSCLFCFDSVLDPKAYFQSMGFFTEGRLLIEIEPMTERSSTLNTSFTHLNCNMSSIEDMEKNARLYWKGATTNEFENEILLTGTFKICRIIDEG